MKRLVAASLMFLAGTTWAGKADVVNATATKSGESYRFSATVAHADKGWDHYADAWRVVTAEGEVLGTRVLHHPHVNEQPFTRSLSGVMIPDDIAEVNVEAHDSLHGWGGKQFKVTLK
ncbi:hypothetical protein [Grimontia sp. NTOU-MAR1]|uniref:hypothetical protein n=1 Tax=Grimontia sp. NTOU-MAR1 TaxID=3111011 RepID=UPI002DB97FE2|nr:hypothetical protein [Grimontia sp. NTOU-MAR1]WRV99914.1 hypothetical protein VP504_23310 [Grimontia sp. NTOU-MAR1]